MAEILSKIVNVLSKSFIILQLQTNVFGPAGGVVQPSIITPSSSSTSIDGRNFHILPPPPPSAAAAAAAAAIQDRPQSLNQLLDNAAAAAPSDGNDNGIIYTVQDI